MVARLVDRSHYGRPSARLHIQVSDFSMLGNSGSTYESGAPPFDTESYSNHRHDYRAWTLDCFAVGNSDYLKRARPMVFSGVGLFGSPAFFRGLGLTGG